MELTHKRYLKITFPFMLSSVAVPVIGAVDTAVVGRLGSPDYISAVALWAVIFVRFIGFWDFYVLLPQE